LVLVRAVYLVLWLTVVVDIFQRLVLCANISVPALELFIVIR